MARLETQQVLTRVDLASRHNGDEDDNVGAEDDDDGEASLASGMDGRRGGVAGGGEHLDGGGLSARENFARPFWARRIEVSSSPYTIPALALLTPMAVRLTPALSLALLAGVEILPGAGVAFGPSGSLSALASVRVEGGGRGGVVSASSTNAAGSVGSLGGAVFAAAAGRAHYVHYAVGVSRSFMVVPTERKGEVEGRPPLTPLPSCAPSSFLPHPPHLASAQVAAAHKQHACTVRGCAQYVPMHSPAWLAACVGEGTRGTWARIPLPLAPSGSGSSGCVPQATEDGTPHLPVAGGGVCQAAFAAHTPGGAHLVFFFTAHLERSSPPPPNACDSRGSEGGTSPVPFCWRVSMQVRTDDARVRAVFAADMPAFVHALFSGRVRLVAHGHAPLGGDTEAASVMRAAAAADVGPSVVSRGALRHALWEEVSGAFGEGLAFM